MQHFQAGELEIKMEDGTPPVMIWSGVSDTRQPSLAIDRFVDSVLEELQAPQIEIDFRALEHMNSSTVPSIIRLVRELNTKRIKTTVIYSNDSKWQQVSFKALARLAKALPNVSVEGR